MSADAAGVQPELVAPGAGAGVIHNIGYRRYDGQRLGRVQIVRALTWQSLRAAFGIGRGAKAKIFPVALFALMCLPAIISTAAMAINPHAGRLVSYDTYLPGLRALVVLVFVSLQAPALVSGDLRYHTLPLYFSRPIGRLDYPLAKLAGFTLACLALLDIPLLILYIGTATQVHGASAVWAQTREAGSGLLYGAAWAVLLASIGLALASTTGRRVFSICAVAIPLFVTWILANGLSHIALHTFQATGTGQPPALASLAGLINPFTVLSGIADWLGSVPKVVFFNGNGGPGPGSQATFAQSGSGGPGGPGFVKVNLVHLVGHFGPLYLVMYLVMLAAALGMLALRYRRVGIA
jgi:ABC-2 type transport system permease protein